MKTEKFDVTKLSYQNLELRNTSILTNLVDQHFNNFNRVELYIAHFNEIPNSISEGNINVAKANDWFFKEHQADINKHYFRWSNRSNKNEIMPDEIFYFLYDDLMVYFNPSRLFVRFLFSKTSIEKVETLSEKIRKFKNRHKQTPYINLLTQSAGGFDTTSMEVTKPKLSIDDNYNDDFKEIHQIILKRLNKKKDKGLVLLHGKPGTGKTSYIRYLLTSVKKKVIFLPPNLASAMTNPSLITFLVENANSILVIEDAENIVIDREQGGGSAVSALLNLSDGLLSDCLNIQIICSFNTDISKVDSALLRKGRLIAKYEFKELEVPKAQMLSNKLGFATAINQPMTLTSIYNQEEKDFKQTVQRAKIGFK